MRYSGTDSPILSALLVVTSNSR